LACGTSTAFVASLPGFPEHVAQQLCAPQRSVWIRDVWVPTIPPTCLQDVQCNESTSCRQQHIGTSVLCSAKIPQNKQTNKKTKKNSSSSCQDITKTVSEIEMCIVEALLVEEGQKGLVFFFS